MNGKFLLMMFIGFNIVSLLFAYGSAVAGGESVNQQNFFLDLFIDTSQLSQDVTILEDSVGVSYDANFKSGVEGITQQQASGTGTDAGFFSILDGLKMIVGLFALLTPLPVLSFFFKHRVAVDSYTHNCYTNSYIMDIINS